jgi:hypothetical protein
MELKPGRAARSPLLYRLRYPGPSIIIKIMNNMAERVTLLACIREEFGSKLGRDTDYTDWGFSWFSSVPSREYQDGTFNKGHYRFLLRPFQFITHYHPTTRRYIFWSIGSAVKWTTDTNMCIVFIWFRSMITLKNEASRIKLGKKTDTI